MIEVEVKKVATPDNMGAMALEKIMLMLKKLGADPKTLEIVAKDMTPKIEKMSSEKKEEGLDMEEKKEEEKKEEEKKEEEYSTEGETSWQDRIMKMCK